MESQISSELDQFSPAQKRFIYENLFAIELTEGCSIHCDFCGYSAARFSGNAIEFSVLERVAEEITTQTRLTNSNLAKRFRLYDATDPLDYESDGKNYFDVDKLFSSKGFGAGISTAIPRGKEELAIANLDKIGQISISHMNRERLRSFFDRLKVAVFIDLFSYYNAKFGRDFYNKSPIKKYIIQVDGSIENKIAELREIDPTLPRDYRFYDLRVDGNRLRKNVQDLKTLFLFCGNYGAYPRDGKVRDRDDTQVLNYGRAFGFEQFEREYPDDPLVPFGNDNGVKITPNGFYNVFSVHPTQENPSGKIIERIDPKSFHVVKAGIPLRLPALSFVPITGYAV